MIRALVAMQAMNQARKAAHNLIKDLYRAFPDHGPSRIAPTRGGLGQLAERHIDYIVGSDLEYATPWIEEGWREGESGTQHITSRIPGSSYFLETGAQAAEGYLRTEGKVTGLDLRDLHNLVPNAAKVAADAMKERLQDVVYNSPESSTRGYNPNTNKYWKRTGNLKGSIKVYRV